MLLYIFYILLLYKWAFCGSEAPGKGYSALVKNGIAGQKEWWVNRAWQVTNALRVYRARLVKIVWQFKRALLVTKAWQVKRAWMVKRAS